ncbi:transketolase [Nematocida major]|uniref:transketolase n=1 Tax=Nematocida major TaxID=1912982 RepID=UPI0020079562|nr:transketolase [Nematocida major]KAH9385294.1 transketolase [Nematocida major]
MASIPDEMRTFVAEMVSNAGSGHPGSAMSLSTLMHTLFCKTLKITNLSPKWPNRDIFILSNGHTCSILYVCLYLKKFIKRSDLLKLRKINSITPGHPEFSPFIEATTGPLGQGVSHAVGYGIALKKMEVHNTSEFSPFTNRVFCVLGDGCLQEGIAMEALSLAGHLRLNNLVFIYDSNKITIDGPVGLAFSENVKAKMLALGFSVREAHFENGPEIERAFLRADRPIFLILHSVIGFGSEKAGSSSLHGSPLGPEDLEKLREKTGGKRLFFSSAARRAYSRRNSRVDAEFLQWTQGMSRFRQEFPKAFSEMGVLTRAEIEGKPEISDKIFKRSETDLNPGKKSGTPDKEPGNLHSIPAHEEFLVSTLSPEDAFREALLQEIEAQTYKKSALFPHRASLRKVFQEILAVFSKDPSLFGASADLAESTCVLTQETSPITPENFSGNFLNCGIREHAMFGTSCGISFYGRNRVFASTFLNFLTYAFPALRIAALSSVPVTAICTHDSVALGGDGPTHQPVEVLALLRATPNLAVFRPGTRREAETAGIYAFLHAKRPCVIVLSRQEINFQEELEKFELSECARGGYVVSDYGEESAPEKTLLVCTGSEVSLCFEAKKLLVSRGCCVRIVSLVSFELFEEQEKAYRKEVLQGDISVSVEALSTFGWSKYAEHHIGVDSFGKSGNGESVYAHFGFTPEKICEQVLAIVHASREGRK